LEHDADTILLHELCHWVIDAKQLPMMTLRLNSGDRYHGEKLFGRTDKDNQNETRHTEEFCILLAGSARRLAELRPSLGDRDDILSNAMRYDVFNEC
jgi:hypothetical protein